MKLKKMNLVKVSLVWILVIWTTGLVAQGNPDNFAKMVDFLPPPPNAASIIKNGAVSLNKNTGAPSISIPLTELKGQKLSLSLGMSYNSTGIKVDEVAGRTGMGWALNAGGVITRTLRGTPDEANDRIGMYTPFGTNCGSYDFLKKAGNSFSENGYASGYDAEPDLFNFSIDGYSGSFVFDESVPMKAMLVSAQPLKIEYDFATNATWNFRITAPNGVKYEFGGSGAIEKSKRDQSCGKLFDTYWANAWYLTKVEHPNGETIHLTYSSHTYTYDNGVSEKMTWSQYCGTQSSTKCINRLTTQGVLLSSIYNEYTKLTFEYGNRSDISDKLLSNIRVYDQASPTVVRRRFNFNYVSQSGSSTYAYEYSQGQGVTPYLASLIEMSPDMDHSRAFQFTYQSPSTRPYRLSYSQDHWGYFNGKTNTTMLPAPSDPNVSSKFPAAVSDRSVSETHAKAGMLIKITYPTGGADEIEYESNSIASGGSNIAVGGLRVKKLISKPHFDATGIVKRYYYGSMSDLNQSSLYSDSKPNYVVFYTTRTVDPTYCSHIGLYSNSLNSLNSFQNSPVSYASVIESFGENFEGGGIKTKFKVAADGAAQVLHGAEMLGAPKTNFSNALNGKIEEEIVYKKLSNGSLIPIKKTFYEYESDNRLYDEVVGYAVNQKYTNTSTPTCIDDSDAVPTTLVESFDMMRYYVISTWVYVKKETITEYDENGSNPLITVNEFFYDETSHQNISRLKSTDGKGEVITKFYKYPSDFTGNSVLSEMTTNNILTPLINYTETRTVQNDPLTESHTTYYEPSNGNYVPQKIDKSYLGDTLITQGTFDLYDSKGNLLQYTDRSGQVNSIIWGYGNLYPVAKIVGASYNSALSYVNHSTLQGLSGNNLLNHLNSIRTGLPSAMVSTYSYKHLAGVEIMVDENNRKTFYDYDSFDRLIQVRDNDGYVIKKVCYNYAGDVENCESPCFDTSPHWQNTTSSPTCEQVSNCGNSGNQLVEQKDMNPCSSTFNQLRTVSVSNPGSCPPTTNVSISYSTPNAPSGYTVNFYNVLFETNISFSVPVGNGVLGCIPAGTYNVTISPPAGFPPILLFGCGPNYTSGTSGTFYNINMNFSTNRIISIDTDL